MQKQTKKPKKKGIAKAIRNKAPRKQTPIIGNTGGAGMWGF